MSSVGTGATLDAADKFQAIEVNGGTLRLRNIHIDRGVATGNAGAASANGGAIAALNGAHVIMEGGSISRSIAKGGGGGVYAENSRLELLGVAFYDCYAIQKGGAIELFGDVPSSLEGPDHSDGTQRPDPLSSP